MSGESILIVEDDPVVGKVIERCLLNLEYRIVGVASTGSEAIEIANSKNPDLILMDINLKGDIDGTEAAKKIHGLLGIPVVFLTAYSDPETFNRALSTTPYGYIVKPFTLATLSSTISVAMNESNAEREMRERYLWLDGTIYSLNQGIISVNFRQEIILMNRIAEVLTEWTNKEAFRKPLDEVLTFIDPISDEKFQYFIRPVLKEGSIATIPADSYVTSRNGTQTRIKDSYASPIRDDLGNIIGAVIVLQPKERIEARAGNKTIVTAEQPREVSIVIGDREGQFREPGRPSDAESWFDYGNYLTFIHRYDKALEAYDTAISLKRFNNQAFSAKGVVLSKIERFEEAIAAYDQALSIKPNDPQVLLLKRDALFALGKGREAQRCQEMAQIYLKSD